MTDSTPSTPLSPCTGVCVLNETTGQCLGCRRTVGEIAAWPTLSDTGKRAVLARLAQRGQ